MTGRGPTLVRLGAVALTVIVVGAIAALIVVHAAHKQDRVTKAGGAQRASRSQGSGRHTARRPPTDPLASLGVTRVAGARGGPSGVPVPRGNLRGWKQVFVDDFPSDEDSPSRAFASCAWGATARTSSCPALARAAAAKWFAYPDGSRPQSGPGTYEPSSVVSIDDHELTYDLHPDPRTGLELLAAMEAKLPVGTGAVRYAAVAVRFKAQPLSGYELSFELWPQDSEGSAKGNIQFPAGELHGNISSVTVLPGIPGALVQGTTQPYGGWHTAVTEWLPGRIRFFLDGRQVGQVHEGVPTYPMNWVLQVDGVRLARQSRPGIGKLDVAWVSAYVPTTLEQPAAPRR